jgi:electron transport complex protein RnfG
MKEMLRYGFILMLICLVASGMLATVNSLTRARIIAQAQAEEEASLKEVLPEAARFDAVKIESETAYYKAYNKDDRLIGVAFKAIGKGYSSQIETVSGMLRNGTITAIKIISHNETPGLGSRVAETDFTRQFERRNIQDIKGVQAITGATISSKAVMDSVKNKAEEVLRLIQNEK